MHWKKLILLKLINAISEDYHTSDSQINQKSITMKKIYLLTLLVAISSQLLLAQDGGKAFGIKFKGFIKHEMIYDSRQTITSRDGTVLLFPSAISEDANGVDINADPQFNFVALTSRLQGIFSGPDAFGAKTSGMLSFDFVGTGNDKVAKSSPRIRER